MMSLNFRDLYILKIKGADNCFIVNRVSKSEFNLIIINEVNLMQNIDLTEKRRRKNIIQKAKYQEQFSNCRFTSNSTLNKKWQKL